MNWVLDADIRGFVDQMSHVWTMQLSSTAWPTILFFA